MYRRNDKMKIINKESIYQCLKQVYSFHRILNYRCVWHFIQYYD